MYSFLAWVIMIAPWILLALYIAVSQRQLHRITEEASVILNDTLDDMEESSKAAKEQAEIRKLQAITHEDTLCYLLELFSDIGYILNEDGIIMYASHVDILGWGPEIVGQHFSVLLHPDCAVRVSSAYVLPGYCGSPPPKLFDERRSPPRHTIELKVDLVSKGSESCKMEAEVTAVGIVSAAGRWSAPVRHRDKLFIGTIGTIRILKCTEKEG